MEHRKTVLITGTGIGRALAIAFHEQGFLVLATARNVRTLDELATIGIRVFELDVTIQSNINQLKQTVHDEFGKLDVLVNNAGQTFISSVADLDIDEVQRLYDVNLFGPMRVTKAFIPLLIAAEAAHVFNVGSVAAVAPYVFGSPYSSSKAALAAFNDALRLELEPFGIKVTLLCTGSVKSDVLASRLRPLPDDSLYKSIESTILTRRAAFSTNGAIPAADFAKQVVKLALHRHPAAWFWFGTKSLRLWFASTFLPRFLLDMIMRRSYKLHSWKPQAQF